MATNPRYLEVIERRLLMSVSDPGHVLILSVDGLHQADVADANLAADLTNTLALKGQGISYTNAKTTRPSDSFPGTLSYLTGAGPGNTGVYYDVSYDRNLYPPSPVASSRPGTVVAYDETIDKNTALLSGGGNFDASSINPALLPRDKNGKPVYPHSFLKVNTIFNVARNAGLYTAFSDKHPTYEIANGPSGNGVNELYTPEINSNVALLDLKTGKTVSADALQASSPFADLSGYKLVDASTDPLGASDPNLELTTNNVLLTEKYDDLKVAAVLNEINGKNPLGTANTAVPNLFGMNFQAVSVAQKNANGGISAATTGEVVSNLLRSALRHTDASVGMLVGALKSHGLWGSTLLVLTAKHGQNPRVGVAHLVKDDLFTNALGTIGVAGATQDDVSLLYLNDPTQTLAAANKLNAFVSTGTVDVYLKGVKSTVPASQVVDKVLYGQQLTDAGLGTAALSSRPDIIVTLKPGYVLVGNPLKYAFKRAEHGGFSADDTNVALILGGGKVPSASVGKVNSAPVSTKQIAVTALNALGLDPQLLKGVRAEHTTALPGTKPVVAQPEHIVVVIMENHDANQIVGTANAPYINDVLIKDGLYYSNAHGTDHDSQPNYLELFSGANPGPQGINSPLQAQYPSNIDPATDPAAAARENGSDANVTGTPYSTPNLGAELLRNGFSFTGYSETLPSVGSLAFTYPSATAPDPVTGSTSRLYVRKHNAWVDWQAPAGSPVGVNQLPASTNQPYSAFPSDYSKLPTVSFVVPNETNDMHDTVSVKGLPQVGSTGKDANGKPVSDATTVMHGDNWLRQNLENYRRWATKHHSLLITLWDENDFDFTRANNIPVIVDGDPSLVQKGVNTAYVNHFNTLRTIEDAYGLGHAGLSASVPPFPTNAAGQLIGG